MASSSTTTATVKGQEDSKTKLRSVKSVAVVGGGISGLAAAYKLKSNGLDVTLFEAEERVGGKLKSVSRDGLIWDEGANTMLESEMEVTRILDNVGLRGKQQFPISGNKLYIVRNGQPEILPTNFFGFIKSSFLSTKSKFRLIMEPFLWRSSIKNDISLEASNEDSKQRLLIISLILLLLLQVRQTLIQCLNRACELNLNA